MTTGDRPTLGELGVTVALIENLGAAGYVIVPREPTDEMLKAAWAASWESNTKETWDEMISAWATSCSQAWGIRPLEAAAFRASDNENSDQALSKHVE
jgi:hypothetical protein